MIKGEAGIKRSRYQEDVYVNNHTSVRVHACSRLTRSRYHS